jgi:hypothetical protein
LHSAQSPATRWLVENGLREIELLLRAIVYRPAAFILSAHNDGNGREAITGGSSRGNA